MSSQQSCSASLLAVVGGALFLALTNPAVADVKLHGYCAGGGAGQCVDNGTNSPTSINPLSNFGFTISPGPQTGDLTIDVLVPNNELNTAELNTASFAFTGTLSGTATLFSPTAWTSGQLDSYLGITAKPNNPIRAYLPSTQALDPGATGFFVFQADLGTTTLQGASKPNISPLENISPYLPLASYLVAFLNGSVGTAHGGAIFVTKAPEPTSLTLLATALVGIGVYYRRRRRG
jgi:hypothetical protein